MKINIDLSTTKAILISSGLMEKLYRLDCLSLNFNDKTQKEVFYHGDGSVNEVIVSDDVDLNFTIEVPPEKLTQILDVLQDGDRQVSESKG